MENVVSNEVMYEVIRLALSVIEDLVDHILVGHEVGIVVHLAAFF